MNSVCYIYGLADPVSGVIRYIGKSVNPIGRLKGHLRFIKPHTRKEAWIVSLRNLELKPSLIILEEIHPEESSSREIFWIAKYRSMGFDLTNGTDGGEGVLNPSPEVREKLSINNARPWLGKKHSLETRLKMSNSLKGNKFRVGKKLTEENKAKIRGAFKGRHHTPESKLLLSNAKKAYFARLRLEIS